MAKTIAVKGGFVRKEAIASSAIKPGHLVEFGGAKELRVHSTALVAGRRCFALENDLVGRGINDAYALNEVVQYGAFAPGSEVLALLTGTCAKGDALESAGDGTLKVKTTGVVIAYAMEAQGTAGGRVRVEVY